MTEIDENDIPLNLVEKPLIQHVEVRAIEESIRLRGNNDTVADVQTQQFSNYFADVYVDRDRSELQNADVQYLVSLTETIGNI